jgi:hypothetical protein
VGACSAERTPTPAGRQPRASAPAPAEPAPTEAAPTLNAPAPAPDEPEVAPPTALPADKGPAPADAEASADARREAVRGILAGGEKAERLPLEATDPGRAFNPRAVDQMAPTRDGI